MPAEATSKCYAGEVKKYAWKIYPWFLYPQGPPGGVGFYFWHLKKKGADENKKLNYRSHVCSQAVTYLQKHPQASR